MKQLSRTILYNLTLITIFFIIYLFLGDQFKSNDNTKVSVMDLLNLSITFQTSVGNTFATPTTPLAKFMITFQQFLLVFGNLFILHI